MSTFTRKRSAQKKRSLAQKSAKSASSEKKPKKQSKLWVRTLYLMRRIAFLALVFAILVTLVPWVWVEIGVAGNMSASSEELPAVEVGLVLGTSPKLRGGEANPFFERRMDAAAELYHAGKVERLLVSGDNRGAYYNEVSAMRKALIERGVPDERIEGDAQGLRTLASIQRAQDVYELDEFVIISQHFHAARAVRIAQHEGLHALGFSAEDVPSRKMHFSILLREVGARVRMMLDLYLWNTQTTKQA